MCQSAQLGSRIAPSLLAARALTDMYRIYLEFWPSCCAHTLIISLISMLLTIAWRRERHFIIVPSFLLQRPFSSFMYVRGERRGRKREMENRSYRFLSSIDQAGGVHNRERENLLH